MRPGFGEMNSTREDSSRMPGVDSASKEGGFGVWSSAVFRVAGVVRIRARGGVGCYASKRQNMQQCLYHYDLNARDTIIEYMQLELSHSSTATRDARARKVSHAVK